MFADGSIHRGENIQNELHGRNPNIYQRSAANGYTFSMTDTVMLNKSFGGSNPVALIYHSHPDVGAYFSQEDQDKALFAGQPIYQVAYLVVDVRAKEVHGAKVFEWNGDSFTCIRDFQETSVNNS